MAIKYVLLFVVFAIAVWPCSAIGDYISPNQCALPPAGVDPYKTADDHLMWKSNWCSSSELNYLMDQVDVDDDIDEWVGYGFDANYITHCDLNSPLTRLLNAVRAIQLVENYSTQFEPHFHMRPLICPSGDDECADDCEIGCGSLAENGQWLSLIEQLEQDEWEPSCNVAENGANYTGQDFDDFQVLGIPGAYKITVAERAGTVVHESMHDDVGHVCNENCDPLIFCSDEGSCDFKYGAYNATTAQIQFWLSAILSFDTTVHNGKTIRKLTRLTSGTKKTCRYLGVFPRSERVATFTAASNYFNGRFIVSGSAGVLGATLEALEAKYGMADFDCSNCSVELDVFHPGQCVQTACNEVLSNANVAVNSANRQECANFNAALQNIESADEFEELRSAFLLARSQCDGPDADDAEAYCATEVAGASMVSDIDECGWLDPVHLVVDRIASGGPPLVVSKGECIKKFCLPKFEQGEWTVEGDELGCLAELCDCGDSAKEANCRKQFEIFHGDPNLWQACFEHDSCKSNRAGCLQALAEEQPPAWTYPQEIPGTCVNAFRICDSVRMDAAALYIELIPFDLFHRDPVDELRITDPEMTTTNPAVSIFKYAQGLRRALARDDRQEDLQVWAQGLGNAAEMVVALYRASPHEFVWMFQADKLQAILGPQAQGIEPRAIDVSSLSPKGQAAFRRLHIAVLESPDHAIDGGFATVKMGAIIGP